MNSNKISDKELFRYEGVVSLHSYRDDGHVLLRKGTSGWRVFTKIPADKVDLLMFVQLRELECERLDEEYPKVAEFRRVFHGIVPFEYREWALEVVMHCEDAVGLYFDLTDGWPRIDVSEEDCGRLYKAAELADAEIRESNELLQGD